MNHSVSLPHSGYRWLNREEEYEIIRRCQDGQMSAKNKLARMLNPYLEKWIRSNEQWITASVQTEELIQVAWIYSDRALDKFNFELGYRFWTYFKTWARKGILQFLDWVFNRKGKVDAQAWLSLDFTDDEGEITFQLSASDNVFEDVSADLMRIRYRSAILEALEVYEETIQQIVLLRLHEGWKWKRIAEHLGLKPSTCTAMLRKVKNEIKANLEYVLQRPLTLVEIGAMDDDIDAQWQVQIKAATEPDEPPISLAELRERLAPHINQLLHDKFELLQEKLLVCLSLVPHRDRRRTPTGDRTPSISAPPIWRWTAPLIALVMGLWVWLWPHSLPWNAVQGHPPRLRGPGARGHPNFTLENISGLVVQRCPHWYWQLCWRLKMFTDLIILTLVLGMGLWVLRQTLLIRRLKQWCSILILTTVALLALQSPSQAGFLTSVETWAKISFPAHQAVLELAFTAIRWTGIFALGAIAIRAFQARRRSNSIKPSKLNKR